MAIASASKDTSSSLIPPGSVGPVPALSANLRYEDMNPSVGGVARDTSIGGSFTDIYSVTGAGLFFGFLLTCENMFDDWLVRLIIDGSEIFDSSGISTKDIEKSDLYGYDKGGDDDMAKHIGFTINDDTLRFEGPMDYPIAYTSSVVIKIKYNKSGSKKFKAGLALRTI